ncbi:MAG TPA: hypothetical protein VGN82_04030 [Bosea sp. (in: a-proteobacteria)]|jgi:hypothetical protein|uniref:hypothetical protein n=1 Tax=Bosea sp. (in: a-proteobacteria) TaxID=1871050 RepID=UPI002E1310B0|nr:hypothetical protein [Bosea sp. (in: a-proteobacteria)]
MQRLRPTIGFVPFFSVALLAATVAQAQEIGPVLTCDGPISRQASHASLSKAFGARNISIRKLSIGEGETEVGSVLFASDRTRRIEVLWNDRAKRMRPRMVTFGRAIDATALSKGYHWRIAARAQAGTLSLGQPLTQVEAVNGKPFELAGFDWDYSGTVSDWRGGALAKPPGGCRILVRFEAAKDAPGAAQDAVSGDREFSSDDPKMRAVAPVIYEMGFVWE